MVIRPYHDYSITALRELRIDLGSSQAQLRDQRSDYVTRGGSRDGGLHELDVLIENLGHQLAAVDQEIITRQRDGSTAVGNGQRGVSPHANRARRHSARVTRGQPKPHCRGKTVAVAVRRPQ